MVGRKKKMRCLLHDTSIDVWYDCQPCLAESQLWAHANGFEQCVSPYIRREGTDNGQWVRENLSRWWSCRCDDVRVKPVAACRKE